MKRYWRPLVILTILVLFQFSCQVFSDLQLETPAGESPTATQPLPLPTPRPPQSTVSSSEPESEPVTLPPAPDLVALEDTLVNLYEKVNPGVVAIRVLTGTGGGLGSGFVIDEEGHIVTNYHVVEDFSDLEISFPSGYKTRGEVLGIDTDSDLAVIKVDAPPEMLYPVTFGDSSQLKVGQTVIAIGNPFGLSGTMTTGIISALGRTLQSMRTSPGGAPFTAGDIIQTDTAINPGNSGGPLLNLKGEVVGVNRAIRTFNFTGEQEPVNSGIGFAIAINIVKRVVPALIEDGTFDYPYLGVSSLPEINLTEQEALELPQSNGAYITSITPRSPADRAGLRGGTEETSIPSLFAGGDLIIAVDGQPIQIFNDLLSYLINYKSPGDVILLTIIRDNEEMEVELTLDKRP
jgi:S1-C subfamily serine protease